MNILEVTPSYFPAIGGVETHLLEVNNYLCKKNVVNVISFGDPEHSFIDKNLAVNFFSYPKIKYFGLLFIWWKMISFYKLFFLADVIHVHDVFIWVFWWRIFLPRKKFVITMHGWEGTYPISKKNILLKQFARRLVNYCFVVGAYVEKFYYIKADEIIYGGIPQLKNIQLNNKKNKSMVWLGRLASDTGLLMFLDTLRNLKFKETKIEFYGNGDLKTVCLDSGVVYQPQQRLNFLTNANTAIVSGYLSAMSAIAYKVPHIIAIAHNPLKLDYWQNSPLKKRIVIVKNEIELGSVLKQIIGYKNTQVYDFDVNARWLSWRHIAHRYEKSYLKSS